MRNLVRCLTLPVLFPYYGIGAYTTPALHPNERSHPWALVIPLLFVMLQLVIVAAVIAMLLGAAVPWAWISIPTALYIAPLAIFFLWLRFTQWTVRISANAKG